MKLVIIGPVYPYRGGIAHHTTMIVRALQRAHHEVHVVSFRRQYPRWLYPGRSDRDPSQDPLLVEAQYLLDPLMPWTWWRSARRVTDLEPELMVVQWWTTFWGPAFAVLSLLTRRAGTHVLFLVHNVLPHEAWPWDRWLAWLALRQGSSFVVQSKGEERRLLSILPSASVAICPHPVYGMFGDRRLPSSEARKRLALSQDLPVLLFFGIVRPYKGLRDLMQAVAHLRDWGKPVHLLVAGELWEDEEAYRRQISRLSLSELVTMENRYIPNEEVALFFSAADVFVAPYTGGTQSGAMELAIGFGLPIVATENIGAEVAAANVGCLGIVPANDPQALAHGIESMLASPQNPPEAQPMGHQSMMNDWHRLVNAIEGLYRRPQPP